MSFISLPSKSVSIKTLFRNSVCRGFLFAQPGNRETSGVIVSFHPERHLAGRQAGFELLTRNSLVFQRKLHSGPEGF